MNLLTGDLWTLYAADCRQAMAAMPERSVHCVVSSPPYWGLRDYGIPPVDWQDGDRCVFGLEKTIAAYIRHTIEIFDGLRRVLRDDGVIWWNVGDSYSSGSRSSYDRNAPNKGQNHVGDRRQCGEISGQKLLIPHRVAIALQDAGWCVRQDNVWAKRSPMPESVSGWRWRDRKLRKGSWRTTNAHEYVFQITKGGEYFSDGDAVAEATTGNAHSRGTGLNPKASGGVVGVEKQNGSFSAAVTKIVATRNPRSVWSLSNEPFKGVAETSRQVRVASGVVSGDMTSRVSPDCPLHASQDRRDSIPSDDGHEGVRSPRNAGIVLCRDSGQMLGFDTTGQPAGLSTLGQSLGCDLPKDSETATPHSTQIRRTDLGPETSSACTPSVQIDDHTESTSVRPESSASGHGTPCCNTSVGDSCGNQSTRNPSGTAGICTQQESFGPSIESLRLAGCTCEYYRTETQKTSHFATFPTAIPRRCIEASTSKAGCCPACGAQYAPVVESSRVPTRPGTDTKIQKADIAAAVGSALRPDPTVIGNRDPQRHVAITTVSAYLPTCTCNAGPPVPAVVFDPFNGSGTTGQVAVSLGRRYVGCEINETYARELAAVRIETPLPERKSRKAPRRRRSGDKMQRSLFAGEGRS